MNSGRSGPVPKTLCIDGEAFETIEGFHEEIGRLLTRSPELYGANLDALTDLLHGGFGIHEYGESLHLVWCHSLRSRTLLDHGALAAMYRGIAERAHPSNQERFVRQAAAAEAGEGPTLFDVLVTLIQRVDNIVLELR